MSTPTKYTRSYSFSGYQATNPSQPLPAPQVDNELENIEQSLGETIDAVNDVRRADGALVNGIVTLDSLAPEVRDQIGEGATASAAAAASSADASASSAAAAAGSAAAAQSSANSAAAARNDASTYRDLADSARTGAQTARDFAAQWASAPENTDVNDGVNPVGKSAYHWAQIALGAANAALPDGSVTEPKLEASVAAKLNGALQADGNLADVGNAVLAAGNLNLIKRDTVSALVADTILAYASGTGKTAVAAGAIVDGGPFRYVVAASAAVDHDLTTAGGVKLYAQALADGSFSPLALGAVGDGVTDDAAILNAAATRAVALGCKKLVGHGLTYGVASTVTIPASFQFDSVNVKVLDAAINKAIVVNDFSKFTNFVATGTGTVGTAVAQHIERLVYPAADAVKGVVVQGTVKNATVGVQGEQMAGTDPSTAPFDWDIDVRAEGIVGYPGQSEGYAVIGTFRNSRIKVRGRNTTRHDLYLASGASNNVCEVDSDGCGNYCFQINTYAGQPASERNTAYIKARNCRELVAGQSGPCCILTESHRNTVIIDSVSSGNDNYAAYVVGPSGGPYPTGNKIINGSMVGSYKGSAVIRTENADSTIIAGNNIAGYGATEVIGLRKAGSHTAFHGGWVEGNVINAQGQNRIGVYDEVTAAASYIGPNSIVNNGTSLRVNDQTGGKRTGWSRTAQFSATTGTITAANTVDVNVALSQPIQLASLAATACLTGMSANFYENAWVAVPTGRASEATVPVRVFNGGTVSKTISVAGIVHGD